MTERTALYRHFDKHGNLLYVGISLSATQRLAQHRSSSPWFETIANVTISWFDSRKDAVRAEAEAIKLEAPIFNKAGVTRPYSYKHDSWGVFEPETNSVDGWYESYDDASVMLDYWKETRANKNYTQILVKRGDVLGQTHNNLADLYYCQEFGQEMGLDVVRQHTVS